MIKIILLLTTLTSMSFASNCTYVIAQERVYYEGSYIEVAQKIDPIMKDLGYRKIFDLSAAFLIDTYFVTLPSRPLDKASLLFTIFGPGNTIFFENAQSVNCYTQICSQTAAYKVLNKTLDILERRFPKCENDEN